MPLASSNHGKPERIRVDESTGDEQRPHDERKMPALWIVTRHVLRDQGLQEGGFAGRGARERGHPGEPSDPA